MAKSGKLKRKIIERAMEDEAFRKQLVDNPGKAIQDILGVSVPDSIEIVVLEETADKVYLILPRMRKKTLSSDDMEKIAAGVQKVEGKDQQVGWQSSCDCAMCACYV